MNFKLQSDESLGTSGVWLEKGRSTGQRWAAGTGWAGWRGGQKQRHPGGLDGLEVSTAVWNPPSSGGPACAMLLLCGSVTLEEQLELAGSGQHHMA